MKLKLIYAKNQLSLWLLRMVLLFSVFTFSGHYGHLYAIPQSSIKIELVDVRNQLSKNTYTLHPSFTKKVDFTGLNLLKLPPYFALVYYNKGVQTSYKRNSKRLFSYFYLVLKSKLFFSISNDEIANSIIV